MRTSLRHRQRASLAHASAVLALLIISGLALAACGIGETASGTTPPAASPSPTDTYGEITPSPAPSLSPTPSGASMAVSYVEPPHAPARALTPSVCGWAFRPKVDIKVSELGCYDEKQDGLARSHRVGIFDAPTRRLLASVRVGPGSELDGAFRWKALKTPAVLQAGHLYLLGVETLGRFPGTPSEVVYEVDSSTEQWAPEIAFGGLRTNLGSDVAFSAPASRETRFLQETVTWMSPNFKFEHVVRLTAEADNPTFLDVPGTAPLAQTEAVAHRYAAALHARMMVDAGLYAVDATRDLEGGVTRGAKTIERYWDDAYHEDPGVIAVRQWSKDYHLLVAPGIAVYEGARLNNDPDDDWRWYLALLAVDGDQITHEEVYFGGNGLEDKWPMAFCQTAPGPGDTAEVAAQVAAAVGQAFATRDRAALEALLAPDVIFPEIEDRPGVSGREALLDWWAMLAPRAVSRIVVKNETPMAGPGWAVLRFTARQWIDKYLPDGVLVSANVAMVLEVRDGRVARMAPYGTAEMGASGLVPPGEGP